MPLGVGDGSLFALRTECGVYFVIGQVVCGFCGLTIVEHLSLSLSLSLSLFISGNNHVILYMVLINFMKQIVDKNEFNEKLCLCPSLLILSIDLYIIFREHMSRCSNTIILPKNSSHISDQ